MAKLFSQQNLHVLMLCIVCFLHYNVNAQKDNYDSEQDFPNIKNLCFDIDYDERIKVNKTIHLNTLTTL